MPGRRSDAMLRVSRGGSFQIPLPGARHLNQKWSELVARHQSVVQEPISGKIVSYEPRALMDYAGVLFELRLSVLKSRTMLIQGVSVLGIAAASAWVAYRCSNADEGLLSGFESLEDAMHQMIIFLLGFFLAEVIGGWKAMLCDDEGGLTAAIDDVCLLTATHFPEEHDLQQRVLRWGLLSHALLFSMAQGKGVADLDELVARGLLTADEQARLRSSNTNDARVPWAWMMSAFRARAVALGEHATAAAAPGRSRMLFPAHSLQTFHRTCLQAVGCIGNALCHIDGKLPFKYIHLLTFMAKFNMILMAMTRGAAIGVHCHLDTLRSHQILNIVLEVVRLIFIPILYQACFDLYAALHNPWNVEDHDFPEVALEKGVRNECMALMGEASSSAPSTRIPSVPAPNTPPPTPSPPQPHYGMPR